MATRIRQVLCVDIVQDAAGAGNQDYTSTMAFVVIDVVMFVIAGTAITGTGTVTRQAAGAGLFNSLLGGAGVLNAVTTGIVQRADSLVSAELAVAVGDVLRLTTVGATTRVSARLIVLPTGSNTATSS